MLPKPIADFINSLVADVLKPVADWVATLAWKGRCAVLVFILLGFVAYQQRAALFDYAALSAYWWRLPADKGPLNLSPDALKRVNACRGELQLALLSDLERRKRPDVDAWTISQVAVALAPVADFDRSDVVRFFRSQRAPGCSCWHQIPRKGEPNVAVSAWIIYAMALLGAPPEHAEIEFLLSSQQDDGSWPLYPGAKPEFASTYATARAILALNEQIRADLPGDAHSRTIQATKRGYGWLANHHLRNEARWKLYPKIADAELSDGVSGPAMQALHTLHLIDLSASNRQWIANLPKNLPRPLDIDTAGTSDRWAAFNDANKGLEADTIRHLRLPWLLVGTREAYEDVVGLERAKALQWLERALTQSGLLEMKINEAWNRAEIMIALNHLLGEYKTAKDR